MGVMPLMEVLRWRERCGGLKWRNIEKVWSVSCTPEILADKKTSAKNPRYLRSATIRPKDYRNSRQVRDASKFLL
jgi:hypothetical protein